MSGWIHAGVSATVATCAAWPDQLCASHDLEPMSWHYRSGSVASAVVAARHLSSYHQRDAIRVDQALGRNRNIAANAAATEKPERRARECRLRTTGQSPGAVGVAPLDSSIPDWPPAQSTGERHKWAELGRLMTPDAITLRLEIGGLAQRKTSGRNVSRRIGRTVANTLLAWQISSLASWR